MAQSQSLFGKSRAMASSLLSPADYRYLAGKAFLSEIVAFLAEHKTYRAYFDMGEGAELSRRRIELRLREGHADLYRKLYRFATPDARPFLSVLSEKFFVDRILALADTVSAGGGYSPDLSSDFPWPRRLQSRIPLVDSAGSLPEISEALRGTPYYAAAETTLLSPAYDRALFEKRMLSVYYREIREAGTLSLSPDGQKKLLCYYRDYADLLNLRTLLRFSFFPPGTAPDEAEKRNTLLTGGRLSPRELSGLSPEGIQALCDRCFPTYFSGDRGLSEEGVIRFYRDAGRRFLTRQSDPLLSALGYLLLQEVEYRNLVQVIEGVRHGVLPDKILSRLAFPGEDGENPSNARGDAGKEG